MKKIMLLMFLLTSLVFLSCSNTEEKTAITHKTKEDSLYYESIKKEDSIYKASNYNEINKKESTDDNPYWIFFFL